MKKMLTFALVLCLLLCSCGNSNAPTEPEQTDDKSTTNTSIETSVDQEQTETEPPTESTQSDKVTVYLLEKTSLYDSGNTQYFYDENYNIDTSRIFTIEDELVCTYYFENKDRNGMPRTYRGDWGDEYDEIWTLSWFEDGKINEEQYGSDLNGSKYDYNPAGNIAEKRQYYEGDLEYITSFSYDGDKLASVYCKDGNGDMVYKCIVENGRIVKVINYNYDGSLSHTVYLQYDKNGNLTKEFLEYGGETITSKIYTYKAVEVDADRAHYLIEQQKYLNPIT